MLIIFVFEILLLFLQNKTNAMKEIKDIFKDGRSVDSIIADLMEKSVTPPSWSEMKNILIPGKHEIVDDHEMRRDRIVEGGHKEDAARMYLGLEKLLARRINQFTFTIPVKREYTNIDNEAQREIAKAIERIYQEVDIDTINMERGLSYFMSCEMFTMWYVIPKENTSYGFKSKFKLHCKTYSPDKNDVELYPLFDEYGDMTCFSVKYRKNVGGSDIDFFETWTDTLHCKWKKDGENKWVNSESNYVPIGKIPGSYVWRTEPIYEDGTPLLRKDAEYKHSEDSDILAYNIAPLIKVVGDMKGDEKKYETRRLIRVSQGGDVSYVQWNGAHDANTAHIQRDIDWFWMLNQMPDISFRNLMNLGNIGYDARQMMLTDAFLKIGEESKPLQQMFRRECNVIKAFLKKMNTRWKEEDIDNVVVKHIITPYIPKDEQLEITKRMAANGGKPVESQRESIQRLGKSNDVDATIKEINDEQKAAVERQMEANMAAMLTQTSMQQ